MSISESFGNRIGVLSGKSSAAVLMLLFNDSIHVASAYRFTYACHLPNESSVFSISVVSSPFFINSAFASFAVLDAFSLSLSSYNVYA